MTSKKTLLIIDMQKGDFTSNTPRYKSESVIEHINALAKSFRDSGNCVIFIQHHGKEKFIKNTEEWEILDTLYTKQSDFFIDKTANDIFYKSKLQAVLKKMDCNEIFVTGSATDFCIEATIQSALTKEYHITVVSDAHTTADRPGLNAKQVIDHYNWVWQHMLPTEGSIQVLDANLVAKLI